MVRLRTQCSRVAVGWGVLSLSRLVISAAIVCLFLIPVCLVTFLLQNQLLRGVTFGTIKR